MKKVGVISDTHGLLIPQAYAALADCDAIIHAGDIGNPAILHELQTLAPVYAVLGNNDYAEYGSAVGKYARPVIEDVRFLVSHYPHDVNLAVASKKVLKPGEQPPNICIHGHTHLPELVTDAFIQPAQLLLCPGSPSRPRGGNPPSIAYITVDDGRILSAQITSLEGDILLETP